jgi:hypothetical protein
VLQDINGDCGKRNGIKIVLPVLPTHSRICDSFLFFALITYFSLFFIYRSVVSYLMLLKLTKKEFHFTVFTVVPFCTVSRRLLFAVCRLPFTVYRLVIIFLKKTPLEPNLLTKTDKNNLERSQRNSCVKECSRREMVEQKFFIKYQVYLANS